MKAMVLTHYQLQEGTLFLGQVYLVWAMELPKVVPQKPELRPTRSVGNQLMGVNALTMI